MPGVEVNGDGDDVWDLVSEDNSKYSEADLALVQIWNCVIIKLT